MSEDKTIWAVSSGEYSDYRVNAIFSTKEAAELYAARMNAAGRYRDYWTEEYPLDPEAPPENTQCWRVRIKRDGDVTDAHVSHGVSDPHVAWHQHLGTWLVICFARDREHAIKIAGEKRQEEMAREALAGAP